MDVVTVETVSGHKIHAQIMNTVYNRNIKITASINNCNMTKSLQHVELVTTIYCDKG